MDTSKAAAEVTLRLERTIAATPDQVFRAWTEAEAMKQWYAPESTSTTIVHAIEPRVGGRHRVEMRGPDGVSHIVGGTFKEVDRPRKLVFSWAWEGERATGETLVTVLLSPEGKGTKLVLLHERFPSGEVRDKHQQGWNGCLERLGVSAQKL